MISIVPKQLPRSSFEESVIVRGGVHFGPQRKGWLGRLLCDHASALRYTRVSHRKPIGLTPDIYDGRACAACGAILFEEQIL